MLTGQLEIGHVAEHPKIRSQCRIAENSVGDQETVDQRERFERPPSSNVLGKQSEKLAVSLHGDLHRPGRVPPGRGR